MTVSTVSLCGHKLVYPRIASTDLDDLRLLSNLGDSGLAEARLPIARVRQQPRRSLLITGGTSNLLATIWAITWHSPKPPKNPVQIRGDDSRTLHMVGGPLKILVCQCTGQCENDFAISITFGDDI
jgi:hypothetical protein